MNTRPSSVTGTNETACSTIAAPTAVVVRRAEERRHRNLVHRVESADLPGRRHRHADDQQRHHEERTQVAERHMKRARRDPDTRGDRQPERKRQYERNQQPPRAAASRRALARRFRRSPATARASLAGSTRSILQRPGAEALGMPASTKNTDQARNRRSRREQAAGLDPRIHAGSPESDAGSTRTTNSPNSSRTVTRSSSRSRIIVAKAAVGGSPSAPREQIRPEHFTGAGRAAGSSPQSR